MIKLLFCFTFFAILQFVIFRPKKVNDKFFNNVYFNNASDNIYLKNCKINKNYINIIHYHGKNNNKLRKNNCAKIITYQHLRRVDYVYNYLLFKKYAKKSKSFCKTNLSNCLIVLKNMMAILKNFQNKYCFKKFRAINKVCLIESVANFAAMQANANSKFNIISFCNQLKKAQNLYKKEEKVLYFLIFRAFFVKLILLSKQIIWAEKVVLKAQKHNLTKSANNRNQLKNNLIFYGQNIGKSFCENNIAILRAKKAVGYFEKLNSEVKISLLWAKFLINKKFVV